VDDKIKVLVLVDHAVGRTGAHRNVVGILNALSRRDDVNVRLLCGKIDPGEPYARSGRIDIRLGFEPHRASSLVENLFRVRHALSDRELVYVPSGLKAFLYATACRGRRALVAGPNVTGIPWVMNPYNPSPLMTTRMSDAWIEMSALRVQQCVRAGTARHRIDLVAHAIDTEKFNPSWRDPNVWIAENLDPGRLKIISVGNFELEWKGWDVLLRAFRLIRSSVSAVDLVLVGKPGLPVASAGAAEPGLCVLGARFGADLCRLLASSDVFLGTSRYETFWFPPLEAMASGVAVVASNVGALPTMIKDGVQGRAIQIVDPTTDRYLSDAPRRLAAAVVPLLLDGKARQEMASSGRARAAEAFSEAALGARLALVFRKAMKRLADRRLETHGEVRIGGITD